MVKTTNKSDLFVAFCGTQFTYFAVSSSDYMYILRSNIVQFSFLYFYPIVFLHQKNPKPKNVFIPSDKYKYCEARSAICDVNTYSMGDTKHCYMYVTISKKHCF